MNSDLRFLIVFRDGTASPVAEVKEDVVNADFSDPHISNIAKGLLKISEKEDGLLIMYGRGVVKTSYIRKETTNTGCKDMSDHKNLREICDKCRLDVINTLQKLVQTPMGVEESRQETTFFIDDNTGEKFELVLTLTNKGKPEKEEPKM